MLVTVIIPCYNVEKYIEECIDSVLSQTYSSIEIICIDNGSGDNTPLILKKYHDKYPHSIRVLYEPEKGASRARNKGIAAAKGAYLQFLDADDLLLPDKIAHQVTLVQANNHPNFIAADYKVMRTDGAVVEKKVHRDDIYYALLSSNLGCTCSNFFKKEAIDKIGGFQTGLTSSQEYDLMFRLIKSGASIAFDASLFTIVRERPGSISRTNLLRNNENFCQLRVSILEWITREKLGQADRNLYWQPLFTGIRRIYIHDPALALSYYQKHIPTGFVPVVSQSVTRGFLFFYKLLGYKGAERLRRIFKP